MARVTSSARLALLAVLSLICPARAEPTPAPWLKDVSYDVHGLDTLDIYRPEGLDRVPAVVFIHGGGWWNGDKGYIPASYVTYFTARKIAVVSINYRNIPSAQDDHLYPPLLGPLQDAERALQFLRYRADLFAIDPSRIALFGESAGAFDALWLGLAADRAEPAPRDPVRRMSTRVLAIATFDAQTSIDPEQMRQWVGPRLRYGGHAFGLPEADFEGFLAKRAAFQRYFPTLSPAALVTRSSPPLFMLYTHAIDDASEDPSYFVHSPKFGIGFAEVARRRHADVTLRIGPDPAYRTELLEFLAKALIP